MCFSASASFTAAAVLVPIGFYGTHIARTTDQKAYAPLAMTPAFFGTQQFVEGLQWIALDNGGLEPLGTITARGFLFFAYCFWMIWMSIGSMAGGGARSCALGGGARRG